MNTKLVESLAEVIESITPDEYQLLQEELKSHAIQKTIDVCGGNARIRNTRTPFGQSSHSNTKEPTPQSFYATSHH